MLRMDKNSKKAKNKLLNLARYFHAETTFNLDKLGVQNDINYRIPNEAFAKEFAGYTVLHFAAKKSDEFVIQRSILDHGANFMIQGCLDGFTPLRCSIDDKKIFTEYASWWVAKNMLIEYAVADFLLSTQVELGIASNPSCRNRISHLHIACILNHAEAVELFLKNNAFVNEAVSDEYEYVAGFTPLHFAVMYGCFKTVKVLLENGADMFAKNAKGISPLQLLMKYKTKLNDFMKVLTVNEKWSQISVKMNNYESMTYLFLKNMVKGKADFVDEYGLSGLHLASTLNKVSLFDNFLKLDFLNINAPIDKDSPVFPNYTPLHFAAHFNTEIFMLLLEQGANIFTKYSNEKTALNLLIENNNFEKVNTVLSMQDNFKNILLTNRITKLIDVLYKMKNLDVFEEFMKKQCDSDIGVSADSPLWPGYGLLHLAVVFNQRLNKLKIIQKEIDILHLKEFTINEEIELLCIGRIIVCLKKIKNRNVIDVNGSTPIHLAFELSQKSAVKLLLSTDSTFGKYPDNCINFTGLSHLHIACAVGDVRAVMQLTQTSERINIATKKNFWWYTDSESGGFSLTSMHAGSTPLHFALILRFESLVKYLLERGAVFTVKDVNQMTPVHLSIGLRNNSIAKSLLHQIDLSYDAVKYDNISNLLHVAAYANDKGTLQALLHKGANVNVKFQSHGLPYLECFSNYSPLQIAMKMKSDAVIAPLIKFGANIYEKDKEGKTLLHYLNLRADKFLNKKNPMGCLTSMLKRAKQYINPNDETGITLLHFACTKCDLLLAQNLIDKGADVNAKICKFPGDLWHGGETPLHLLIKEGRRSKYKQDFEKILELLLDNGADVTAEDVLTTPLLFACRTTTPGYQIKHRYMHDDSYDYNDNPDYMQMDDVHEDVKCFFEESDDQEYSDVDSFFDEVSIEELFSNCDENDDEHDYKAYYSSGASYLTYAINLMLRRQKSYAINPTDRVTGWSHFHCACVMNNTEIVKKFLESGVDVNLVTNPFTKNCAGGCTPLHLAIMYNSVRVIRILMENGADLEATDRQGNTLLHIAASRNFRNKEILEILLRNASNVNAKNCIGQTPMELLLTSNNLTANQLKSYLNHGCQMVFFQSTEKVIGLLGLALRNSDRRKFIPILEALIASSNVNWDSCNAIQSVVAIHDGNNLSVKKYLQVIERLVEAGCELDEYSEKGNALTLAIKQDNLKAVKALLMLGAEISVVDKKILNSFVSAENLIENNALFSNYEYESGIKKTIIRHMWKQTFAGLKIKQLDLKGTFKILEKLSSFCDMKNLCAGELEKMKESKITNYFNFYDMLMELHVIAEYPTMIPTQRQELNHHFKPKNIYKEFPELGRVLMLQYRRAQKRLKLWKSAMNAATVVLPLPDLCLVIVLKHLPNDDLMTLIEMEKSLDQ